MSGLGRPAVLAWLLSLAALALHPLVEAQAWLPAGDLVRATLLLLAAAGLVTSALGTRGGGRIAAWLVAAGALAALAGVGLDGVRGRSGTVRLAVGQGAATFEEKGPRGRSLGLRPLGFRIGVERATEEGVVLALGDAGGIRLRRQGEAIACGGFRLANPRVTATGEVAALRVAASDGTRTEVAELAPGQPARAADAVLSLEQYFPDFALDANRRPFTRSLEPRNPAALLRVEKGGESHRAFVIQSMPGIHRVEPLGLTFTLLEVQPRRSVAIDVHREPFAAVLLAGGLLMCLGVALGAAGFRRAQGVGDGARTGSVPAQPVPGGVLAAAVAVCVTLLLVDGGHVLAWTFGVPAVDGRAVLGGVGLLFGAALIACLGGASLLAARAIAGSGDVVPVARAALWLAVAAGAVGLGFALVRAASAVGVAPALRPLGAIALALVVLAVALRPPRAGRLGDVGVRVGTVAALAAALAIGALAVRSAGSYAAPATLAASSAALLGLAAGQPTGFVMPRRLLFLIGLVLLLARAY